MAAARQTITSANSKLFLTIPGLYDVPQAIQGYSVDDAFTTTAVEVAETQKGVDGIMSAGWLPTIRRFGVNLQANSLSILVFEDWDTYQTTNQEVSPCNILLQYPGLARSYVMTYGILKSYMPLADAAKVLRPRKFEMDFDKILAQPL